MSLFRILKKFVLNIYKGLIYWFFWASFISMRDELFCSYTAESTVSKSVIENTTPSPVKLATALSYDLLACSRQLSFTHPPKSAIASYIANLFSILRVAMLAAKDLPEKHRARLRFSSD